MMKLWPSIFTCFAIAAALAEIPLPLDAPQPLSPEDSAVSFKLPTGFCMEVIASEPHIASPTTVCWDERGRMFVSELHGYNLEGQLDIEELNKTGQLDTQIRRVQADKKFVKAAESGTYGVVKMLTDQDGDGRMDQAITWARDLPPVYGIVPARGGIIVACAPDIVFLADRDGDGKAKVREKLFTGFRTGALERGINAPQWAVDGWIYFGRGWGGGEITGPHLAKSVSIPDTDFRIRSDGSAIEPLTGGTHTFGFAMTESGDRFVVNTTIPAIFVAPLPWRYLVRNPDSATSALENLADERRVYPISKPHPWRTKRADDPEYFKYYNSRYGAAESDAEGWFSAACGPLVYQDHALPGLHGQYFVCEPSGNLIHRAIITADGPSLKIKRPAGEETSEFAATHDSWSHPVSLSHGPDGAIWVVDYYREIIEDYSAIPRHLQQQYQLYNGHDRGRIHRLSHRDAPTALSADMSGLTTADLVRETASSLIWRRQTAQRLLTERGDSSAPAALYTQLHENDATPASVINVLHTLNGLNALTPSCTTPFLSHPSAAVRIHALQLADRFIANHPTTLDALLVAANVEKDPRVLLQVAMSLGEKTDPRAFAMLARYAREHSGIRWMDAAVLSSLAGRGGEMLAELVHDPGLSSRLLEPLANAIAARADKSELTQALAISAPPEIRKILQAGLAKLSQDAVTVPLSQNPISATTIPAMEVSDATFRQFTSALSAPRNLSRGHQIFTQACSLCHKIGEEGHIFGPDLLGELSVAEETLIRHILLPNEHIRPGYETVSVQMKDGGTHIGLLKADGATSITLSAPGGIEQILLRKNMLSRNQLPTSMMPSFANSIAPADLANMLAWLRSQRAAAPAK